MLASPQYRLNEKHFFVQHTATAKMGNKFDSLDAYSEEEVQVKQNFTMPIIDNQYRIEYKAGSGNFGIVYCATDLKTNNLVALKFIDASKLASMAKEIEIHKNLDHPNIIKV